MSDKVINRIKSVQTDKQYIIELSKVAKYVKKAEIPTVPLDELKKSGVDLSEHLHFIRHQGGFGCWGMATLAVWDIMNEMNCPYSPNLSVRFWLAWFKQRKKLSGGLYSPDGRFHEITKGPEWGNKPFFKSFGCPTEGTEPTLIGYPHNWPEVGWTEEGINEASNYQLAGELKRLESISSEEFMKWLKKSFPIRIGGGYHIVALVGYDPQAETFKYVNSGGDKWGPNQDGYGTITFKQVDEGLPIDVLWGYPIYDAYVIDKDTYIPPRSVPAARISFKHTNRCNVHLWLSVEDSPLPKKKIWSPSPDWDENSRSLSFTVRLPSEFIWPPSNENRLVLDLYDAASFSNSGGTLEEFKVAFGKNVIECTELSNGPISFKPREYLKVFVP